MTRGIRYETVTMDEASVYASRLRTIKVLAEIRREIASDLWPICVNTHGVPLETHEGVAHFVRVLIKSYT